MSEISMRLPVAVKKWWGAVVFVLLFPPAAYYGIAYWDYYQTHVSTDDAYVRADVAQITPHVSGTVSEVPVNNNWRVTAGQLLVRLDSRDYEVQLAKARAELQKARETVRETIESVKAAAARVEMARAQAEQAAQDFQRSKPLFDQKVVSAQEFDHARTVYDAARANLREAEMRLDQAKAALGGDLNSPIEERSVVRQAAAAVRQAELNLSYCSISSPIDGWIGQKGVDVGQHVEPGQPLMAVVPLRQIYIEANYKETQLAEVRVGQPAEIRADIYPDYVFRGRVDSLSAGTGAAFSLLPPENATGNWVKVVQRVPVKISLAEPLPPDRPLRVGLSVAATIDTTDHRGPLLTSLLQQQYQGQRK